MDQNCTCGAKFRDGEDFRDHLPCPLSIEEQLKAKTLQLEEEIKTLKSKNEDLERANKLQYDSYKISQACHFIKALCWLSPRSDFKSLHLSNLIEEYGPYGFGNEIWEKGKKSLGLSEDVTISSNK